MAFRTVALVLAVGLLAGCGSGAADKAGGSSTPVVLRLADSNNSDQPDTGALEYFAAQVARRSGGNLRVRITYMAAGSATPYVEERTIAAVRAGRFDLGWIGARAWDEVGVKSFRALQAPFLITSKRLLDRVVTSPLAGEMLDSLKAKNVVGVALVPDYLRHPAGMGRPLVSPADFDGARVRISAVPGERGVDEGARRHPHAISNSQIGYAIDQKRVDGQELAMLSSPGGSVCRQRRALRQSADAVREPRFVQQAHRRTAAHPPGCRRRDRAPRRRTLPDRRADRHALLLRQTPDSARNPGRAHDARAGGAAGLPHARGRPPDEAVHPADPGLEAHDPSGSRDVRPRGLQARTTPPTHHRPPSGASLLDGTYRWVLTRDDAHRYWGPQLNPGDTYPLIGTAILRGGTWRLAGPDHDRGTFTIHGNRIRFDWPRVASVLVFTFTRDGDGTLHLKPVLPMDPGDQFVWAYKPWQRIGPPTQTAR